jgi:hypothetical protein
MKTITILTLVLATAVFSCSDKFVENEKQVDGPKKWQLVKMIASWSVKETTGSDMNWQEHYIFNPDGTFSKSRTQDGQVKEASGTYVIDATDKTIMLLTYKTGFDLLASCMGNQSEQLRIESPDLIVGTWRMCDGPGLEYKLFK